MSTLPLIIRPFQARPVHRFRPHRRSAQGCANRSSPRGELTRLRVGSPLLGAGFEAAGLPPGLELDATSPIVSGVPTEAGSYDVVLRQLDGGEIVAETSFTWIVRPTTDIEFPL